MKAKLSPKTTLRIAMQGKAVTKVLTVFLCAFSFALFALASTGYNIRGDESVCLPFGGGGYLPL